MRRCAPLPILAWLDFGFESGDVSCGAGDSFFLRGVLDTILLMGSNLGTDVSTVCVKPQELRLWQPRHFLSGGLSSNWLEKLDGDVEFERRFRNSPNLFFACRDWNAHDALIAHFGKGAFLL